MRHPIRLGVTGLLALALMACSTPAASPSATPATPAPTDGGSGESPAPSADPSIDPSAVPTAEPIPSDDLADVTCDFPIVEGASAPIANIVDVRVGEHAGYDRVVFEFQQGTPEFTLDRAQPPFVQDASGLPVEVDGESFLMLRMRGGTKQTDAGTSSYDGPTDLDPEGTSLLDLVEGGDFERQSTWYLGLNAESCVRVMLLEEPHRLVIDVEH